MSRQAEPKRCGDCKQNGELQEQSGFWQVMRCKTCGYQWIGISKSGKVELQRLNADVADVLAEQRQS